MLLERFGLWDARHERAGSLLARDAAAARALPGAAPRAGAARSSTSRTPRSTRRAPSCSTASSPSAAGSATFVVATHDPERLAPLASGGSRSHDATLADVAALARKDLLLELRARRDAAGDAALRRSRRSSSSTSRCRRRGRARGARAALGRAPLHRAARAHARVRRRAGAARARRARPRALRPQRDLAREGVGDRWRSSRAAELVALPGLRALLRRPRAGGRSPRSRSRTSASAPSGRSSRRWPRPAARASCCCRSSSCRSRCRSSSAAWVRAVADDPARYLAFLALYDAVFAILAGPPLSTSSRNRRRLRRGRGRASCSSRASRSRSSGRPTTPTRGSSQRIFYVHVPIALTAYACFGWGAWKALRLLWTRRAALRPRELHRRAPGRRSSGCSRSSPARSGRRSRGASGGAGASGSSCSSSSSSSSTAAYFMLRFSLEDRGRAREPLAPSTRSSASC